MISFLFDRRNDLICGFSVHGHAMFAEYGKDVVCASVSSAVMLTVNLITENFAIQSEVNTDNNIISFKYNPSGNSEDFVVDKILKGLVQHIEMIGDEFKGCIKTEYSEV